MSRIEKALEKAAELRNKHQDSSSPVSNSPERIPDLRRKLFPESKQSITIDNPLLVPSIAPHSPIAEEYRKLKSVLVKLTRQAGFHNTILITSAVAGEGKTVTALNLAISLAQEHDHTVLLVDADLRRPSIHSYLGITPDKGLSDCLINDLDVSEALINTGIGRLVLLPAGKEVTNPVELFSSQRMERLMFELKHRYPDRYIIIDSPPVLPFAEVHTLSHLVDGVLFVVRERLAPFDAVKEGLATLKGCSVLGMVYNNVEMSLQEDRYYYRYASSYQSS